MDGSNYKINSNGLWAFFIFLAVFFNTPCFAKNIYDILKPTKNTLNWLDRLDDLDTLEHNNPIESEKPSISSMSKTTESVNWVKKQAKIIRSFSEVHVTENFSMKPGKIKSRPLKFSDLSEYYALENVGELNEPSGSQKGYGVKFNYEFK